MTAALLDAARNGLRVNDRGGKLIWSWAVGLGLLMTAIGGGAQESGVAAPATVRARRFLAGRDVVGGASAAGALDAARREHLAMVQAGMNAATRAAGTVRAAAQTNPLNASWQAVGPLRIASQRYGDVTGRVTSVAIDPADASGNTVYVGTTGGGVWKSVNAAGPAGSVVFVPLTDVLPVFSANAGTAALPSLSIGAVSVSGGVVLAGTGDANDASDSYYGEGILRSVDGGVT